jgi:ABC-type multidrug transport system fused ATPase/permease subunit
LDKINIFVTSHISFLENTINYYIFILGGVLYMDNLLVEIKNIGMTYHSLEGETEAIKNINLNISKGEIVGIVGPSGCGKSTLLSIVAGLIDQVREMY